MHAKPIGKPFAKRLRFVACGLVSIALLFGASACSKPFPDDTILYAFLLQSQQNAATPDSGTTEPRLLRVFVSNQTTQGNGGISGFDSICNSDANRPNTNSYKAMVVQSTVREADSRLDWVFEANTSYYNASGARVLTTNAAAIVDFGGGDELAQPFSVSNSDLWWTGMQNDWSESGNDCSSWGGGAFGQQGQGGSALTYRQESAVNIGFGGCGAAARLVCVEQL